MRMGHVWRWFNAPKRRIKSKQNFQDKGQTYFMSDLNTILNINAHLKYVEYLLHVFDNGEDSMTLKEIRNDFKNKFLTIHPLHNQYFAIYRLITLILIREKQKGSGKKSKDEEDIMIIRHSIAHNNFEITPTNFIFNCNKGILKLTYEELVQFIYRIENKFYNTA